LADFLFVCRHAGFFVLFLAPKILTFMGQAGLKAMSKIMGFIVLSIGIQLIISSVISILSLNN
jgi:multiple antibiotic resistance protein